MPAVGNLAGGGQAPAGSILEDNGFLTCGVTRTSFGFGASPASCLPNQVDRMRSIIPTAALVLCLHFWSSSAGAQEPDSAPTYRFAIVAHGGPGNPFWNVAIQGMEDAAARYGVQVQWLSNSVYSIEEMASFIDDAIASDIDGLGITCPDPEAIRENVLRADEAGIPVIVLNTADPNSGTERALPSHFYVGASEFKGGQSNGRALLAAAANADVEIERAVCPIQELGHNGLEARVAGFRDVLEAAGVEVDGLTISNDVEEAAGLMADYFLAHPESNAIATLEPLPADAFYLIRRRPRPRARRDSPRHPRHQPGHLRTHRRRLHGSSHRSAALPAGLPHSRPSVPQPRVRPLPGLRHPHGTVRDRRGQCRADRPPRRRRCPLKDPAVPAGITCDAVQRPEHWAASAASFSVLPSSFQTPS